MNSQNSKHMKMNARYIVAMFFGAMAAACTVSDLTPETGVYEEVSEGTGQAAEGMRVVDYSVSEGAQTKALGEGLPASDRISSLIYLLYNSSGSLEKERVIPDIECGKTQWPLTRKNMTWAQREALKDTLAAGLSYTAVFVANADPELFGLDGSADDQTVLHYKNFSQSSGSASGPYYGLAEGQYSSECTYLPLSEIYLSLPSVPFGNGNMFYLDVVDISAAAEGSADVHNAPVTLERIVSRTDISRVNSGTEYLSDEPEGDEAWRGYISDLVEKSLYPSAVGKFDEKTGILGEIRAVMEKFADDFSYKAASLGQVSAYSIFANAMKVEAVSRSVLSEVEEQIKEGYYLNNCETMADLRNRMVSWENANVTFVLGDVASKFMIKDQSPASDNNIPEFQYIADGNGVVSVAGFGDGSFFNSLSSVSVGDVELSIPARFNFWHGMNVMNSGEVNPLASLTVKNTENPEPLKVTLNMLDILETNVEASWDEENYLPVFKQIITEAGNDDGIYSGSLEDFIMTISIPACKIDNLAPAASIQ